MIPRRPRPLCAICADRVATTITEWECESGATRTIVACWPCLSPVPDPPEYEPVDLAERRRTSFAPAPTGGGNRSTRDAVVEVIAAAARPLMANEIAAALGCPCPTMTDGANSDRAAWRPYEAVAACLSRAVRRGELCADWTTPPGGGRQGRAYYLPRAA